jgi:kynurenine formamidase
MSLVDLTQPLDENTPVYPGDPDVDLQPHATYEEEGYRVSALHLGSHSGTHVDAPSHVIPDGKRLSELPLDRFRFEAQLVDVRSVGARSPIRASYLPDSYREDVDLYVFRTDWSEHRGSDGYFLHPYLAPETARECADREVSVALDVLSPDPVPSVYLPEDTNVKGNVEDIQKDYGVPAHEILLGNGLLILENLGNLDSVPERFRLHAYPLYLESDGSPVRAVAEVAE